MGKNKHTIEEVQRLLDEKNLIWIDGIYVNNCTPLKCVCKICKKECFPRYNALQQGQGGCSRCGHACGAEKQKTTYKEVQKLLNDKDLIWVDGIFNNVHAPLNCVCSICNYSCYPTYLNLQQNHSGCKNCAQKKRIQTNLKKYGVESPIQNKEVRLKAARSANKITDIPHWNNVDINECQGGYEVRSVNYLNGLKKNYIWQPQAFVMPDGRTYAPDCLLVDENIYIEIKGYFRKDAREKWEWFHKEYPNSELWDREKLKELGIL